MEQNKATTSILFNIIIKIFNIQHLLLKKNYYITRVSQYSLYINLIQKLNHYKFKLK